MADNKLRLQSSTDVSCYPEIPQDILTEILMYLPVKTLLRLTCVCKSWFRLIRADTQFAIRHYMSRTTSSSSSSSSFMDNNNIDYLVDGFGLKRIVTKDGVVWMRWLCMYSLTEKKTFRLVKKLELGTGRFSIGKSNFCHGIMCIHVRSSQQTRIFLCNPAIGSMVPVPVSPNIICIKAIGLGYDPSSNDYKIIVALFTASPMRYDKCEAEVYSFRNSCWHSISNANIGSLGGIYDLNGPALNANGRVLNWLDDTSLLSFDMEDEVFYRRPMPEYYPHRWLYHSTLLDSSRCLACLCCVSSLGRNYEEEDYIYEYDDIDIWVLYDDINIWVLNVDHDHEPQQVKWSKQTIIKFHGPEKRILVRPLKFWINDKELIVTVKKDGIKEGRSLEEVFHYDCDTRQLTPTGRYGSLLENCSGYTASLISVNGILSASCQEAASAQDGQGNKVQNQEQVDEPGGSVFYVREVGRRSPSDVRWSYSYNL